MAMVRMTPLMYERLRQYAAINGCDRSTVIRCAIHSYLLQEGIDAYSALPQPMPSSS
jgi:predicted DNA-binding protein